MLPTFFGLNTVTRALLAQQEAVDVVNQNISNVNTPGYSRQEAQLEATDPYTDVAFNRPSLSGQLGTGVFVSRINRFQDELLNSQIRFGNQDVGRLQSMDDLFLQIQAIYNDPSNVAVNSAAGTFFNSIHDLTNNPESDSARQLVTENGTSLSHAISTRYGQLTTLQQDLNTKVGAIVADINNTIRQMATLNERIAESTGIGDNANDLMDKRDNLADHLSQLIDVRVVKNVDGTDTVQMNGRFLVNKDQAYTLTTLTDASSTAFVKPVQVFWQEDVTKFSNLHPGYDPITGRNLSNNAALRPGIDNPPLSVSKALITTGSLFGALHIRDDIIQNKLLPQLNELSDSFTNTQALSLKTGLKAGTTLTGSGLTADDFTVTVVTPQGAPTPPGVGQRLSFSLKSMATPPATVQDVIDGINSSAVAPFVHASLNAAGQLQIDTISTGTLVKVDHANGAASKDFGFSASVADGFNMVHVQGYGLDTPPQFQGGISGLNLNTTLKVGDQISVTAPDGTTTTITVPKPATTVYPPPTTTTVGALIDTINAKGLSHGFQATLDPAGHLEIFSTPTVYGADGHLVGTAAQITSDNVTAALTPSTVFTAASSFTINTLASGTPRTFSAAAGSTLGTLMTAINAANIGVTASVNSVGQFQLTSTDTGKNQFITISGQSGDFAAGGLIPLATGTTNGLDSGFPPSSVLTVAIGGTPTGNEAQDFFGGGTFPPAITATNSNQFFFQGAQQRLAGVVLPATSVAGPFNTIPLTSSSQLSIAIIPGAGYTAGNVLITGIDATTGQTVTDTLVFGANGGVQTTTHVFSSISPQPTGIQTPGLAGAQIQVLKALPETQADTAGDIVVDSNVQTNPGLIAASSQPGIAGNDSNGLALLNIQQQNVVTDGQSATTIGDFYSAITESLGADGQQTHTDRISQEQLVQHFTTQKLSVVGVNLDEEAAHLVALQHAYQAAARAITTQDSMLDTIINGMGLVGRS